jgi:DNA repair protein RecO (recombination protein O)
MSTISDRAVVIRLSEYAETSQIVSLFTERHGLLRLIAKGIRRGTKQRFAAGVDLLESGEVSFVPPRSGAGLSTLTAWAQHDGFSGLRGDLARLYAGLYAAELLVALTEENDPHAELFCALGDLLNHLSVGSAVLPGVTRFQLELLRATGYLPELEHCVSCGGGLGRGPIYFSSRAGGLLCRDCEMHFVEKTAAPRPAGSMPFESNKQGFELLNYHLTHLAGRAFRTSAQLAKILR